MSGCFSGVRQHELGFEYGPDAAANSVTLDNGSVYKLPASLNAGSFKVGEKVKIKIKGDEVKVENDD